MQMYSTGKEALGSRRKDAQHGQKGADSHRYRPQLGFVALLILCVRILPIPRWSGRPLTLVGLVLLGRSLLRFKRWGDEHRYVLRFGMCFFAMLVELIIENCLVWLVAASDMRKYEHVPGLQDNVEIAIRWIGRHYPPLFWVLKKPWCETAHFLGMLLALAFSGLWDQVRYEQWWLRLLWAVSATLASCLLLAWAFSGLWDQTPYSGFGLMARSCLTICCSRALRSACFLSTVLPNPIPGCYGRRFPPVPDTAWGVLKVGYTHIRGFGGCNDLIFSGHAAFWVIAPLALQDYYGGYRWTSWAAWVAVVHACIRDVIDKQHYSVDMLLGIIVTWAVWTWLTWVYPPDQPLPARARHAAADKPNPFVLGLIAFGLFAAGVIVIGGKA